MMIYLDYASHTPCSQTVLEALIQTEQQFIANPMSAHIAGKTAQQEMMRLTQSMAELLHVRPQEIIFTSGASEANNLAIKGIAMAYGYTGRHILSTCLEHPSVSGTLVALQEEGYEIELLRILANGDIDLAHLESAIRPDTVLVCVSTIDSELGAVQPIDEIAKIVSRHPSCHLHVDAAQAMGKIPVNMHGSTMCFSPHKFYGLTGSGVLVKREGIVLTPMIHGGTSTTIYRSGTPALGLVAACYKALELALSNQSEWLKKVKYLCEYVQNALAKYPNVRVNSPANGSPYILNLSVKGVKAIDFTARLSKHGVCVSIKSACSTNNAPSRPVMAVTNDKQNALSSWRLSFSHLTEKSEIDDFLSVFNKCCNLL